MKEKIDGERCEICENQLILNYSEKGPSSGICNECGAIYSYELEDSGVTSVNFYYDFPTEIKIISEYYEETSQRAYIISHVEYSEDERRKFLNWARENYPNFGWSEL